MLPAPLVPCVTTAGLAEVYRPSASLPGGLKTRLNQNVNTFWGQKAGLSRCLSRGCRALEPGSRQYLLGSFHTQSWCSLGPLPGASRGATGCQGDQHPICPTLWLLSLGQRLYQQRSICSLLPSLIPSPSIIIPSVSDKKWHLEGNLKALGSVAVPRLLSDEENGHMHLCPPLSGL